MSEYSPKDTKHSIEEVLKVKKKVEEVVPKITFTNVSFVPKEEEKKEKEEIIVEIKKPKKKGLLFIKDTTGICTIDSEVFMDSDTEKDLMWMYKPTGEKVGVCDENRTHALDYKWTYRAPETKVKLFDNAPNVYWTDGLSQIFTCYKCKGKVDPGEECDWVRHDESMGGCGGQNIIAGGNSHSRNNANFRKELNSLTKKESLKDIEVFLSKHKEATAFWGLDGMLLLFKESPKLWLKELSDVLFVHDLLQNLVDSLKALMKEEY